MSYCCLFIISILRMFLYLCGVPYLRIQWERSATVLPQAFKVLLYFWLKSVGSIVHNEIALTPILHVVASQVKNVLEMPHNDHLPLIEASR